MSVAVFTWPQKTYLKFENDRSSIAEFVCIHFDSMYAKISSSKVAAM